MLINTHGVEIASWDNNFMKTYVLNIYDTHKVFFLVLLCIIIRKRDHALFNLPEE